MQYLKAGVLELLHQKIAAKAMYVKYMLSQVFLIELKARYSKDFIS